MSSAPEAVPAVAIPWDLIETFGINQKRDGNFTCSGVKDGGTACGWNIRGGAAASIQNLIDSLSMQPPGNAIPSLRVLAEAIICHHHKNQIGIKTADWRRAITRLQASSAAPQPAPQPTQLAPPAVISTPRSSPLSSTSISTLSSPHYGTETSTSPTRRTEVTPPRRGAWADDTADPWEKIGNLEAMVHSLSRRLEALETGAAASSSSSSILSKLRGR